MGETVNEHRLTLEEVQALAFEEQVQHYLDLGAPTRELAEAHARSLQYRTPGHTIGSDLSQVTPEYREYLLRKLDEPA